MPVFNSKSKKSHSDSNEIDFQWSVQWLLQTVKIWEKNDKVSQLYAHLTIFHLFLFLKKCHTIFELGLNWLNHPLDTCLNLLMCVVLGQEGGCVHEGGGRF